MVRRLGSAAVGRFDEVYRRSLEQPEEFWADDKLQELVERNRKDFESIDRLA